MSISSSNYADYANAVRKDWIRLLRLAFNAKDWEAVEAIIHIMDKYWFGE